MPELTDLIIFAIIIIALVIYYFRAAVLAVLDVITGLGEAIVESICDTYD